MDFGFSPEVEAFRKEVRQFLKNEVTPEVRKEGDSGIGWGPYTWELVRKLGAKGWLTPTWPKNYGGLELPSIYRFIIHEELDYAEALPHEALTVGAGVAGPTILIYGSEEQKNDYLPRIARATKILDLARAYGIEASEFEDEQVHSPAPSDTYHY